MARIAVDTRGLATAAALMQKAKKETEGRSIASEAVAGGLDLQIRASELLDRQIATVCRSLDMQAQAIGQQYRFLVFAAQKYEAAEDQVAAASAALSSEASAPATGVANDGTRVALETISDLKKKLLDGLSDSLAVALGSSPGYGSAALSDLFDALLDLVSLGAADYVFQGLSFAEIAAQLALGNTDGAIQMLISDAQQMAMDLATGKLGIPGIPLGAIAKIIEGYYHLGQALGENNLAGEMVQGFKDGLPIVANQIGGVVGDVIGTVQDGVTGVGNFVGDTVQAIGSWRPFG